MDELDQYGPTLFRYEGIGEAALEGGITLPVYFDARQLDRGTVVIGCMGDGWDLVARSITKVSGLTTDGKELETIGSVQ